jgi:hypothetical protein
MALVNPQLQKQIEELFPLVVAWVEEVEKEALEKGEPVLPPFEATAEGTRNTANRQDKGLES